MIEFPPRPFEVERVGSATYELVEAMNRLIPQVSDNPRVLSLESLQGIINGGSDVLIARQGTEIVGTVTIAYLDIPSKFRAELEDVAVDEASRRQGVAEALMNRAIEMAQERGASRIEWSSHPRREAANHLYRKLGAETWGTNRYRLSL